MQRIIEQADSRVERNPVDLTSSMIEKLNAGFRIEQDCILFAGTEYFGPGDLSSSKAKIEYEEFINSTSTYSYLGNNSNHYKIIIASIEFAKKLYDKLKQTFPDKFRVVVRTDNPSTDPIGVYGSCECNVRFYKIRAEVDKEFREEILTDYGEEGMMMIE